jgi:hypothetical protein
MVPLAIEFLLGNIKSAKDCITSYLTMLDKIKVDIAKFNLSPGIQQFRYVLLQSPITQYISQNEAAYEFVKFFNCKDKLLPDELLKTENVKLIGGKRKREDNEED